MSTESSKATTGDQKPATTRCPACGRTKRSDCDGLGWVDAIGPCDDGSYITSRPCPNENPFAAE